MTTPVPAQSGPLRGITVLEMAGLGPAPLAALMLAQMGARVLRIERTVEQNFLGLSGDLDYTRYGRSVLKIDLKRPEGVELVLRLAEKVDILIEGFRPRVMERLGLGPDVAQQRNPRLIYGRVTGFGQEGALAHRAGHDLSYLAYTGILHAIGQEGGRPAIPLNLVGDYGGGTMFLVAGVLAALVERSTSGKGQVVDAAMMDGALNLAYPLFAYMAAGQWADRPASNLLDSGSPFYDTYETADGRHVAVACLEPHFFAEFARLLPLDQAFCAQQYDRTCWPAMRAAIAARLKERDRDAWAATFEGTDACVAPVLSFAEARRHDHNVARGTHIEGEPFPRPAPAPRLSRSKLTPVNCRTNETAVDILRAFGVADAEGLTAHGVAG
ncbi:MAG: CaiB/BaiF CoA transferase family protein [Rhizobiaceae bacterium]